MGFDEWFDDNVAAGIGSVERSDPLCVFEKNAQRVICEMAQNPSCRWTVDDDDSYDTECGNKFIFTTGNIVENKFVFCPYCGGKIEV